MPIELKDPTAPQGDVLAIPLRLEGVFAQWLRDRARAHGETVEEHAARIMRAYWAHHDTWRHEGAPTLPREGGA